MTTKMYHYGFSYGEYEDLYSWTMLHKRRMNKKQLAKLLLDTLAKNKDKINELHTVSLSDGESFRRLLELAEFKHLPAFCATLGVGTYDWWKDLPAKLAKLESE